MFGFDLTNYEELFNEKLDLFAAVLTQRPVTWRGTVRPPLNDQNVYPKTESGRLMTWIGVGGTPDSVISKLYRKKRRFLCRHCCRMTYARQCEARLMRLRFKALKAVKRLDGNASSWVEIQRPKGMWQRTYDRLHKRAFDLDMQAEDEFESRRAQLEKRAAK